MLARHSLVWLSADGWEGASRCAPPDCVAILAKWRKADWPLITRRRDSDAGADEVCLGMALPPDPASGIKKRIAIRVPRSGVRAASAPVAIDSVLCAVPETWRPALAAIASDSMARGIQLRVYGSVSLQALTRQGYLSDTSDIDLLLYPSTAKELEDVLQLVSSSAKVLPLDGEIVFPSGQAVAWKEWLGAQSAGGQYRVLVKDTEAVRLLPMADLLSTMEAGRCAA